MSGNRVLRIIFGSKTEKGTGVWRKLYDAELHTKYCGYQIKKDEMRGACGKYDVRGWEWGDVHRLSVEKSGGTRQIGRLRRRMEDDIQMDLKAIGGILWTGFSGSERGQVAVSCELSNKPVSSIKCAKSHH
jgi:hypothetical protein